jgi:hypothetical protein
MTQPVGVTGTAGAAAGMSGIPGFPVYSGPTVANGTGSVTASSAHKMLISVALELAFVVVATMLAGISDTWATGILTLMLALLVLRGLFQVNVFGKFVNTNNLVPNRGTSAQQQQAKTTAI